MDHWELELSQEFHILKEMIPESLFAQFAMDSIAKRQSLREAESRPLLGTKAYQHLGLGLSNLQNRE